jgi:cobalt-zinc-cadmium efflux system protein
MAEETSDDKLINKKLKIGMVLNAGFAFLEITVGIAAGSLALISDASHNLTDSLSLLVAWAGQKISKKPATQGHTFGYGKATILTALTNSIILIAIAGYIFYEAYQKIVHPSPVKGGLIMIVAGVGIIVNTTVALMFLKHRDNLNMRGAFLNMAFDALASVGAVLAGLIIYLTGKTIADPIVGIVIGLLLIYGSVKIINDAVHILLEGVPKNIDVQEVEKIILNTFGVKSVHDLHLWSIASQKLALNCHIIPEHFDLQNNVEIIKQIKQNLRTKLEFSHITIEAELEPCPPHEH